MQKEQSNYSYFRVVTKGNIDLAFFKFDQFPSRAHQQFCLLNERDELERFSIPDLDWFKGADAVLGLVRDYTIQQTSFDVYQGIAANEGVDLSDLYEIDVTALNDKETIRLKHLCFERINNVTFWKKAFRCYKDTLRAKKRNAQFDTLFPFLGDRGYETKGYPKQSSENPQLFVLTVSSNRSEDEVLYMTENDEKTELLIQGGDGRFIGIWEYPEPYRGVYAAHLMTNKTQ